MRGLAAIVMLTACPGIVRAQAVAFSQHATVSQRVGVTDILVEYNRPVSHNRTLFGPRGVVRPGRIWTPGADSTTRLTVSRAVRLAGHELPAGRYSLWLQPAETGPWTLIVSTVADTMHMDYPGAARDAMRATIMPDSGTWMDALAFYFPVVGPDSTILRMHWGTTIVPIAIRTTR